jgi:hypothetical protein
LFELPSDLNVIDLSGNNFENIPDDLFLGNVELEKVILEKFIFEIFIFEKENPIAKGIAYSPYSKKQLLNVPVANYILNN